MNAALPQPDLSTFVPSAEPGSAPTSGRSGSGFVRPTKGRRIGGVCAAIADRFGWDRTVVRLVTVLSVFVPGPQVLAYIVAWIVMPGEEETTA